ncbi:TPA: MgtC family protein [Klebsiella pneumoniae]
MVFPYMTHLLAAMLLGALIGAERQWRQRMAGLRTNALVATGAAVFILSAMSASPDSPGRIAAQIVSGIGFLGAGVIMRDGMNVRGLNTAATLWCSAGIGVLCGLGQFWNATAATLIILCANILLREAAQRIHALPGAGDEEKRYVLRVTCLREHENAVRQLLLNIAQQQRFTLQGLQSARARLTLDDDQLSLIARLDALGQQLVSTTGRPQGVYVWGRTGRGKSFILDHFFASLPLAARRRVHFHHFFRELHQRLNAPGAPDLQTVMRQMTSGCRLLCFDEFHLHDPGDAMLIKALLEHLFQHGIVLLATSNYPPEMLLPNPLYHDRFLPSIALIRAHLTVVALNGEEDYRERHLSQDNAFCSGRMWVNPNAQQRQLYDLPSLPGEPVSLTVGYRTLLAVAASPALLHFTFTQLCQAATAVMDYLTLCESYAVWLLDEVPPLATVGPAAQQRFINVIDVLYEKQIRLLLVTRCDLETLVAGVELEDIQRTRSRLQQLPRAV